MSPLPKACTPPSSPRFVTGDDLAELAAFRSLILRRKFISIVTPRFCVRVSSKTPEHSGAAVRVTSNTLPERRL